MATDLYAGPVDYLVFSFPEEARADAGLKELLGRVDAGLIEILDVECVAAGPDGSPVRLPLGEVATAETAAAFDGVASDILDSEDLATITGALPPGSRALAVVYEERSLATTAEAWATEGGRLLMSGGIEIDELEHSLDVTEAVGR